MLQHAQACTTVRDWLCLAAAQSLCAHSMCCPLPGAQYCLVRRRAHLTVAPLRAVSGKPLCAWSKTGRKGLPVAE